MAEARAAGQASSYDAASLPTRLGCDVGKLGSAGPGMRQPGHDMPARLSQAVGLAVAAAESGMTCDPLCIKPDVV